MTVLCSWCVRDGNVVEPPGEDISHGICERHAAIELAKVRERRLWREAQP